MFVKAVTRAAAAGEFAGQRVGDGDGFSFNCADGIGPLLEHQNLLDFGGTSAAAGATDVGYFVSDELENAQARLGHEPYSGVRGRACQKRAGEKGRCLQSSPSLPSAADHHRAAGMAE